MTKQRFHTFNENIKRKYKLCLFVTNTKYIIIE